MRKYSEDKIILCLISGFRLEADENCVLLGFTNAVLKFIPRFGGENVTARSCSENLDGKVISKLILQKYCGKLWTGFIWLWMESL